MEPVIRKLPAITVAGLQVRAKRGETDFAALWTALGRRAGEIQPRAESHDAYGVTFGFDLALREFDYLAGYPIESGFRPRQGSASFRFRHRPTPSSPPRCPG